MIKEHIAYTAEQLDRLQYFILPLNTNGYSNLSFYLGNVRSYTLRNNFEEAFYSDNFTKQVLEFLTLIDSNTLKPFLQSLAKIIDISGTDRTDPIRTTEGVKLVYMPKGLTDFEPSNKNYNDSLTGIIRRALLKMNNTDPNCPETDKSITVKVFGGEGYNYLHVYFNKYAPITLKRLFFLVLMYAYPMLKPEILFKDNKALMDIILLNLCNPTADSAELILNSTECLLKKLEEEEEKDLIKNFATKMQTSMNSERKRQLDSDLRNAEEYYTNALENLIRYSTSLKNAQQNLINYNEVDFSAITVFLEKIKQHPNTKSFKKINSDCLQFIVEEPIIYTDDKVWSKYISNSASETRQYIYMFARDYHDYYNTTSDILDFCIQRLFKEVLVDQKIKLFTASAMYLNQNNTSFRLEKNTLPDSGHFFPHPHLGTNNLTCWGNAITEITKAISADDGETAFLQMMYAFQQMTATDNAVVRNLTEYMLNTRYSKCTVYQKGKDTERTTFEKIIKEFVEYETNKINTPSDTSGETGL